MFVLIFRECLFDDEEIEPPRKRKKTEPPSKNINVKKEVESENDEEEQEMGSSDIDSEECGDIVEDLTYSDFK